MHPRKKLSAFWALAWGLLLTLGAHEGRAASVAAACAAGITVDGVLSEASWNGPWTPISKVVIGGPVTITAQFKVRWSPAYLYVAVDVNDTTPWVDSGPAAPWDDDSVEIYLDMNNAGTASYQPDAVSNHRLPLSLILIRTMAGATHLILMIRFTITLLFI